MDPYTKRIDSTHSDIFAFDWVRPVFQTSIWSFCSWAVDFFVLIFHRLSNVAGSIAAGIFKKKKTEVVVGGVRFWPIADICNERVNVCYRGKSGHFRHQSGLQILQVANCYFMSAIGDTADMAYCTANVRL